MGRYNILNDVFVERDRQEAKWGEQNHPDGTGSGTYPLGPYDFDVSMSDAFDLAYHAKYVTDHSSDIVSDNISKDADEYKVFRQIVVYNGVTDQYILEIEGYCSLGNDDPPEYTSYTCKSPGGYVKDIIYKSDNTFVFAHQLYPINVSQDFFQVTIKPTSVIPNFDFR